MKKKQLAAMALAAVMLTGCGGGSAAPDATKAAGAVPISGSNRLDRLDTAIKALDIRLEHYEWYEIYKASGQQAIR